MAGLHYTVIKRFANNYYSVTQIHRNKPEGVVKKPKEKLPYIYPQPMTKVDIYSFRDLRSWREERDFAVEEKSRESLSRARTLIFEKAMCNEWDWFSTFTLDPQKYDRYNLRVFYKEFSKFIQNLRNKHNLNIKYLFIPEMHEDGAWHMHGLISGLPRYYLDRFTLKERLPHYIRKKLKAKELVFDWPMYRERFGFCDLEPIRNMEACCKYIVKYITKDLGRSVKESHANVYYCSKGLNRATVVYAGEETDKIMFPHFSTVYCDRKDFFTFADALEFANVQYYSSFADAGLDEKTIEKIIAS